MKHGSQPSSSRLRGQDKLLVWCESLPVHLVYLCTHENPLHFWHPWVGCTLQHSPNSEEKPGSGLTVGAAVESWPSLNLPRLVIPGCKWLPFSQFGGVPTSERGAPLVVYKWSPKQHDKDMANSNQVVCFISCQGLCAHIEWLYLEFQFTATNFVSMAAKSSNLVDETSGVNLQMEGHMDVPPQSARDLQELEAWESSPSHLLSWSPAQRLPSGHPNMKHC